ncbi:MAG: hypothetical protein M3178_05165 [Pseudomonadota bacterium]|nr:hypothetical protein [Pseudomonadota bacterium]
MDRSEAHGAVVGSEGLHKPDQTILETTPEGRGSLALHTQAVLQGAYIILQGAYIMAKTQGGAVIAAASIDDLRRYIELLF